MVDDRFLKTLHDTFPPGHVIDLFNSLRREVIFQKIKNTLTNRDSSSHLLKELRTDLEDNLCHPLLLPTTIAGCLVGNSMFDQLLKTFLEGGTSTNFSQSWVSVSADLFDDTKQLEQFLKYEQHYCSGLYAFLLDSFKPGGKNMFAHSLHSPLVNQLVERGYESSGIKDFKKEYGFSPHVLRFNAWKVFNAPMAYLNGLGSEREAAILFRYGFAQNSFWHNTNDFAENDFEQAKRLFNRATISANQEIIMKAVKKLKISECLLRRTRRLYWWNPCEAHAHDSSESTMEAFLEGRPNKHKENVSKNDAETT